MRSKSKEITRPNKPANPDKAGRFEGQNRIMNKKIRGKADLDVMFHIHKSQPPS